MPDGVVPTLNLSETLEQVAERITRHRRQDIGEQNTKVALLEPVLRALGWDTEEVDEVRREYRRRPRDKPVDYALLLRREPVLFVEAKGLGENLADRRWTSQVISYATVAGVGWVVLSDGDEYRIYNAHAPVPVEDKLFRRARLSEDPAQAEESLALLSKGRMQENALAELWKVDHTDGEVRRAVEALFSPEPKPWLVRRLAKEIEDLTPGSIRAALARARITPDFPSPPPRQAPPESTSNEEEWHPKKPRRINVTLQELIAAGLVDTPLELRKIYLGRDLRAIVEDDGRVAFGGTRYRSLSVPAGMARASVPGAPTRRPYPQTNGWTFWHFRVRDGDLKEVDVLRQRFFERQSGHRPRLERPPDFLRRGARQRAHRPRGARLGCGAFSLAGYWDGR